MVNELSGNKSDPEATKTWAESMKEAFSKLSTAVQEKVFQPFLAFIKKAGDWVCGCFKTADDKPSVSDRGMFGGSAKEASEGTSTGKSIATPTKD
ncbi:MAG: hypothetical protein QNK11_06255 [Legionella sp.]|nr:hypothetical protein [Legionella sp.]